MRKGQVICVPASFDRGHKVSSAFDQAVPEGFQGIVESGDIFFLKPRKGSRGLPRKQPKRGDKDGKRGVGDEQVTVVATCDRSGKKEFRVATKGRTGKKDLDGVFEGEIG